VGARYTGWQESRAVHIQERAAQIRREGDTVLHERGLFAMARRLGETFVGGSYFFDLMVWRDLDLYIKAPDVSIGDFFSLGAAVTERFGAWKSFFTDNRACDPSGLYWGIRLGDLRQGAWKFDIWAVDAARFDHTVLQAHQFVDRLTADSRDAILRIKAQYWDDPRYRGTITSAAIYEAVLDSGVRTVADFETYMALGVTSA